MVFIVKIHLRFKLKAKNCKDCKKGAISIILTTYTLLDGGGGGGGLNTLTISKLRNFSKLLSIKFF